MTSRSPVPAAVHRLASAALKRRGLLPPIERIRLGTIRLLPHQMAAVRWIVPRLTRFGGALLADPPGLGKTYVALAIAAQRAITPLVIAPAAIRERWLDASRETGIHIRFISTERLSAPAEVELEQPTFVIIDEAHHLRTRSTRRHQRTMQLCAHAKVLLLSATPIQNRRTDLSQIAALFHAPQTRSTVGSLRRRMTLRRTLAQIRDAGCDALEGQDVPRVCNRRAPPLAPRHPTLHATIAALPPIRSDTDEGHVLLQLGLLHALRSSDAAARERVQRRIAVTLAIELAADAGVEPSASLRSAWQSVDGTVQLAMPQLLGQVCGDVDSRFSSGAREQRRALEALLPHLKGRGDVARSRILRRLARWCARPVVAFTQFSATAARLFQLLRGETGIALLTGSGAQIATGAISRVEVLQRLLLDRYRARHDAVRLLIATDVLSEGLSLAGVATVIHLDLPWTAARLDQRVGRAARIGAPVPQVNVLTLPAPLPDSAQLALHTLLARKRHRMTRVVADDDARDNTVSTLRAILQRPVCSDTAAAWMTMRSARVQTPISVAIVRARGDRWLVVLDADGLRPAHADDWVALAEAITAPAERGAIARLRGALAAWLANSDLTAMVTDSRDQRLHARQSADDELLRGDRVGRAQRATAVSATRRTVQSRPRCREVRILAGVLLLPAEP